MFLNMFCNVATMPPVPVNRSKTSMPSSQASCVDLLVSSLMMLWVTYAENPLIDGKSYSLVSGFHSPIIGGASFLTLPVRRGCTGVVGFVFFSFLLVSAPLFFRVKNSFAKSCCSFGVNSSTICLYLRCISARSSADPFVIPLRSISSSNSPL